jgi:hypothetical protein
MPWYAWVYLAGLSALIVYSAFDDLRSGDPFLVIVVDLLEGCAYWIFVVFWYRAGFPARWAAIIPVVLVGTAMWSARRARHAFRRMFTSDSELTLEEKRLALHIAMAVGIIIIAPAYFAGVGLMYRLMTASGD